MKSEFSRDERIIVSDQNEKEKRYWLRQMSGDPVKSFFPYDHYRFYQNEEDRGTAVFPFQWTGEFFTRLMEAGAGSPYKIHIILAAGLVLLLEKYTGNRDIVISTPIYKPDIDAKFVNTVLPLRIRLDTLTTFKDLLKVLGKTIVGASEHQNFPMDVLLERIHLPLREDEPSLPDTALFVHGIHHPEHIRSVNPKTLFSFSLTADAVRGEVEYPPGLYDRSTMETIAAELEHLLYKGVSHLDAPLPGGGIGAPGKTGNRVTLNGLDISLEEIETPLQAHEDIHRAAVIIHPDSHRLCAYFVSQKEPAAPELRDYLARELPPYLIPADFIQLEEMPLSPGGAVDRETLNRAPVKIKTRRPVPTDSVEEKLVEIWSEILEVEKDHIRTDDDFSRLSGQSLQAIMMSTKIHREFEVSIAIPVIFELSTIVSLAEYIRDAIKTEFVSIEPVEEREYYLLSPSQKRLYFLQQLDMEKISYNVSEVVRLQGDLEREKLGNAYRQLIRRHESLRTSFELVKDVPVQRVHREAGFDIEYFESENVDNIVNRFVRPFDLTRAPLLRVGLIKESESRHILMVDRHHLISDAVSRGIFLNDLIAFYEEKELPPLKLQYKDFSQWQNSDEQRNVLKQQEHFWLKRFQGEIPVLALPTDFARPEVQSFEGGIIEFSITKEETAALKRAAENEGATLFMVVLAVYNVFLAKICDQEDIVVGTPVVGRRHADLENIIGLFINTLALRNFPRGQKTFKAFLAEVKTSALNAFENQMYQFEELVEKVSVKRDAGRNPLFDTMFTLRTLEKVNIDASKTSLNVVPYGYETHTTKFDLTLQALEENEKLTFGLSYCTSLFKRESIKMFVRSFKEVASAAAKNIHIPLQDIVLTSDLKTIESNLVLDEPGGFGF